jgi:hypothetical protein
MSVRGYILFYPLTDISYETCAQVEVVLTLQMSGKVCRKPGGYRLPSFRVLIYHSALSLVVLVAGECQSQGRDSGGAAEAPPGSASGNVQAAEGGPLHPG